MSGLLGRLEDVQRKMRQERYRLEEEWKAEDNLYRQYLDQARYANGARKEIFMRQSEFHKGKAEGFEDSLTSINSLIWSLQIASI